MGKGDLVDEEKESGLVLLESPELEMQGMVDRSAQAIYEAFVLKEPASTA